jgi:hypothetical protein
MSQHELSQIQRWLQTVITHPGGTAAGLDSEAARAQLDVVPADVEQVISPSQQQSSVERLEIYAQAYFARLSECLRAEFPMTVEAIGEELFDEFAVEYLQRYPSQSYTLDHLGANFARFLSETRPTAGDEDTDQDTHAWLDFLPDLARLEWNLAEVFDGPGAEQLAPLGHDALSAIPPECWSDIRLVPVPCLRIVAFDFPIDDYYRGLRAKQSPLPPARSATWLAITRRDYVVRHYPLSATEAALLTNLVAGLPLGESIERAAPTDGDLDRFAVQLRGWFQHWSAEGFFQRVAIGQQTES